MNLVFILLFTIVLMTGTKLAAQTTLYVDASASGSNNGTNWTNAYTSFQSALDGAVSGDQIWVAKGTYNPSYDYGLGGGSRYYHFRMINGVAIYGGFTGTESAVSERTNYGFGEANETILSGDIGAIGDNTDNCYHVIYHPSFSTNLTAILDGFTITDGNADDGNDPHKSGGGMHNDRSSPTLTNCTFTSNSAKYGGGLYNFNQNSPSLTNCTFILNSAVYDGGGMLNKQLSTPAITNCTFTSNSARYGGGLYNNSSSPYVTNCAFTSNSVSWWGGGMFNNSSSPTVTNCTFTSNSADESGGGIFNYFAASSPTLNNCIVWGNDAPDGDEIYNNQGTITLNYSCYANDTGDVYGTPVVSHCITSDPCFVGVENNPDHPYSIGGISPCCDTGNDSYNSEEYDIRGEGYPRKLNKSTGGSGTIDMGAYEYKIGTDPTLPVTLSAFTAEFINNTSTLYWETQSEVDNLGWNLYRNVVQEFSNSEQITHEMIPGNGTITEPSYYNFEDTADLEIGHTYYYWLESIDYSGISQVYSRVAQITIPDPSVNPQNIEPPIVYDFKNIPNPISGNAQFQFTFDKSSMVSVSIYNILGELVQTLPQVMTQPDETAHIYWNGKNSNGKELTPGVYFYNLIVNGKTAETKKLILMR